MAQVTVTIDGKAYRMACEEGQEGHLMELSSQFDRYVSHLKSQFGEIGDLRITVMAGIMVMDEFSEVSKRLAAIEAEVAALRQERDEVAAVYGQKEEALTGAVFELTERLNGLTRKLNARSPAEAQPGN